MSAFETQFTAVKIAEQSALGDIPVTGGQLINVYKPAIDPDQKLEAPKVATPFNHQARKVADASKASYGFQHQAGNFDLFREGLLANDWTTLKTLTATTITCTGGNTLAHADSGLITAGFGVGWHLFVRGGDNNGRWIGPILTLAAGSLTVPAGQLANQSTGTSITIHSRAVFLGTLLKFYALEESVGDGKFHQSIDQRVVGGKVGFKAGGFVEESFELSGGPASLTETSIFSGAATAAPSTPSLATGPSIKAVRINGVDDPLVTIASLDLDMPREVKDGADIRRFGPAGHGTGKMNPKISMVLAFASESFALTQAGYASEVRAFDIPIVDVDGNATLYALPAAALMAKISWDDAAGVGSVAMEAMTHHPANGSASVYKGVCDYELAIFTAPAP